MKILVLRLKWPTDSSNVNYWFVQAEIRF